MCSNGGISIFVTQGNDVQVRWTPRGLYETETQYAFSNRVRYDLQHSEEVHSLIHFHDSRFKNRCATGTSTLLTPISDPAFRVWRATKQESLPSVWESTSQALKFDVQQDRSSCHVPLLATRSSRSDVQQSTKGYAFMTIDSSETQYYNSMDWMTPVLESSFKLRRATRS